MALPVALLVTSGLLAQSPPKLTVHFALDKAAPLPADAAPFGSPLCSPTRGTFLTFSTRMHLV
ncbi:MAG: hypothetical protein JNL43_12680 [Flavobacteriales bacterium]|nr:hypothetical protein [Flavobacteriales bacterium]